jgi:hypothetical protein
MKPAQQLLNVCMALGYVLSAEAKSKITCDRPCINGGICKNRLLQASLTEPSSDLLDRFDLEEIPRQYCQCPTGFIGALCEIKLVLCSNGNQTCANGNTCQRAIDDYGSEYFHCECDLKSSDLSLPTAQKFCEHASTVFCINDGDAIQIKQSRESLGGSAKSSFCINGGRCKDEVERGHHHAGCSCPKGYSGHHCEISAASHDQMKSTLLAPTSPSRQPRRYVFLTFLLFLICFVGLSILAISMLIMYGNRNRIPRKAKSAQERSKIPKQSTQSTGEVV